MRIKTNKPVAFDSPDHIQPWGTANDNSINLEFNKKLRWWLPLSHMRVLDLACSGGGFVKSILDEGGFAVGVEGSDYSKKIKRAEWATIPSNLFTADITETFELLEADNDGRELPLKFNVITAWEFIEHVREDQLPTVFSNISKHLETNGVVIMSVSPNEDVINGVRLHQTVQGRDWWIQKFIQLGFVNHDVALAFFGADMVRGGDNAPNSFHVVLTRIDEQLPFKDRLHPLQYGYANFCHGLDITARLTQLGTFNSCPLHVIDAGAQGGFEACWDAYGNQIELIGFEADADECKRLNARRSVQGRKESFYPMALYRNKGTKTLHLTKNGVASSFLPTNLNFVSRFPHADPGAVVGSAEVQTTDLDSFVKESGLSYVDFIKVDVEGAELAVLEGARQLLSESILGLSIEIFFQPYRVGQPTFAEIDGYLKQFNFSLFNLEPERWVRKTLASHEQKTWYRSGQMMWAQAIYFKDIVPELSMDTAAITGDTRMKALKLATLSEVFGFPDYSVEIVKYL